LSAGCPRCFLIESILLGRPTLSIQIGLNRENPFIFDRRGISRSILSEPELRERLRSIVAGGERITYPFEVIRNPVGG